MPTRTLFLYLALVITVVLIVFDLILSHGDWLKLIMDILPNLIAGLLAFFAIYYFITRRNVSIADLTGDIDKRSEFRQRVVPAGRSLTEAMNRATDAFYSLTQDAELRGNQENFAAITYIYQNMLRDIFHAYERLLESWLDLAAGSYVLNPMLTSKEYIVRACQGRDAVVKKTKAASGVSGAMLTEALEVLKIDLETALREVELVMKDPHWVRKTRDEASGHALQRTGVAVTPAAPDLSPPTPPE